MKKGFLLFISLFLLLGMLAGCSSKEDKAAAKTENGKVVVNFWSFWGSETRTYY
ncbi:hypothetical protein RCG23_05605 [Neobacillus sp. PS3-34]|uniref:hypothetical protein n=1 Tax=Neobacillus sp. PS3-34 TaxID=3070678 RepID=UPI0027E0998A|nr:hypothetical protein [Neobacillus sp. PS3-34]WML49478.1 hypothetical protein RCG23_05605 [Neobacillus sp. PS3-34]